jgi:hypothetical protein
MARINNFNSKEAFSFYQSFDDYMAFVDKTFPKIPANYGSRSIFNNFTSTEGQEKFIGSSNVDELNSKIKDFIDPPALDNAIKQMENIFSLINLGGSFAKDKMVATDLPIGVFDFSLASKGLFRYQEYYCETLNKVVPSDDVVKISDSPRAFVYIERIDGIPHTYNVIEQQKGTFEISKKNKYISELMALGISEENAKKQATEKFPLAKLVFRTKTKKVNLIRQSKTLQQNKVGDQRYVDIFITIGGLANQTPRSLMYKTMPSLLVAYFMNRAGIKTRILGLVNGAQTSFEDTTTRNNKRYMTSFVIKNYEDSFDFNEIAILTADSRIFRWKLFKAVGAEYYDKFNFDIDSGLGNLYKSQAFLDGFERYKKFYIEQQKAQAGVKNQNSRLMFASELTPLPSWSDEQMMEVVEEEFFRIVDAIDIEFNGADTAIQRIRDRELKRGNDLSNLRQRLVGTINLATSYDESDSPYSATDKEIGERLKYRQELTKSINTAIKTI